MRKLALPLALVFGFAMVGCSDDDSCVDVDGDGYGEGSGCLGPDCDDDDMNVWMDMEGYPDVDEDGVFAETSMDVCTDGTLPAEYSATAGTDCDDTAADAYELVDGYVDADGDGYGTGDVIDDVCGSDTFLPPGYADNADDCDDASDIVFENMDLYPDRDEDMVYDATAIPVCTDGNVPAGFSETAGTDCDDMDQFASDDSSTLQTHYCLLKGTCADTEMFLGQPDLRGIGACLSTDCNGGINTTWEALASTTTTCDATGDCSGDPCFDATDPLNPAATGKTCWTTDNLCNYGTAGCNGISTCLTNCKLASSDPTVYMPCMQGCVEDVTAKGQYLYGVAQSCSTTAGCFMYSEPADVQACALAACNTEFMTCLGHTGG